MSEPHKKPGVAFWATVVVVVGLILYPVSFGPACWLASRTGIGISALPEIYHPIVSRMGRAGTIETSRSYAKVPPTWILHHRPSGIISRYATFLAGEGWHWDLSVESDDQTDLHERMRDGKWTWSMSPR